MITVDRPVSARILSTVFSALLTIGVGAPLKAAEYPASPYDFAGVPFPGRQLFNPVDGIRPVETLIVFIRFDGIDYTGVDAAFLENQVFGFSGPSFAHFLRVWSNGSAFLRPAQESSTAFGGAANDGIVIVAGGDANTRALTSEQKRRLGLDLADPFVDYSRYDSSGDGRIDNRELAILVITGDGSDDRQEGGQDAGVADSGRELDGVGFTGRSVALAGGGSAMATRLHEFIHQAYAHVDLYGYGIGQWDIMGSDGQGASSFTKLLLGWATPQVVSRDGWHTLRRSDRNEDLLLLYDPDHGTHEYFLIENRIPDGTGLSGAPDSGIYIQRINSAFWGSSHRSEPIAETIRPDGMPLNPACTEFSVLAEDADAGDTGLRIVQNYFGSLTPRFDVVLARDGESDLEEIVTVVGMDDDTLTLGSPLALAHGAGTEAQWTRRGFGEYFATELAGDFDSGGRTLAVGRVAGNVPATPFDAALGDTRVTINDVTAAAWTMADPVNADLEAGTSLRSLWQPLCNGSSDTDAWDTADVRTERFHRFEASWGDGSAAPIGVLAIGSAAETAEVYVDVPADERAFYLQRGKLIRIAGSLFEEGTSPPNDWELRNTGSESDSYRVQVVDDEAREWMTEAPSLDPGESTLLSLPVRRPVTSPPGGLEVMYRVESMIDPTVFEVGTLPVDWPFPERRDDSMRIAEWTGNEPDQRIFAPLAAGSGVIRSTSADFDGIARPGDFGSRLSYATISPLDDSDSVSITLPDLVSELLPLLDLPAGQPVPATVNDCGRLGIIEFPGPFGPETIELRSVLEAAVVARDRFEPPADVLRPAVSTGAPIAPPSLSVRLDCPYPRFTDTDASGNPLRRVSLRLVAGRERLQRYAYEMEVEYRVQLLRVPGDSVYRDLAEEDGRGIPCSGGFFPICAPDAFGRFETPLPTPRLKPPGCPADGCPDHFVFAWQGGEALDLDLLAPASTQIALLDAFGTQIREALPAKPAGFLETPVTDAGPADTPHAAGMTASLVTDAAIAAMSSPPPIAPEDPAPPPPSPFEPDPPALPARAAYSLEMINVPQGLYFLQVALPPDHDPVADSSPVAVSWRPTDPDGDSVPAANDNCPDLFNPDQSDFDRNGSGDACDGDDDGDLVSDEADRCPATRIPEPVPLSGVLEDNNWTLHRNDGVFTQAPPQRGTSVPFTTAGTKGCSCEQIVAAARLGEDQLENGCSTGVMRNWSMQQ